MNASTCRCACLLAGLLSVLLAPSGRGESPLIEAGEAEGGRVFYEGAIPVAAFAGTPEQIGRQHAALLGKAAQATLEYPQKFSQALNNPSVNAAAGQALLHNAPAGHRQEMDAMVASGLDAGNVAMANTLVELSRVGCSTLIVEPSRSATDGPLFGRNFDFPALDILDKYGVVMVYRPAGKRAFASVAFPGMAGVISGMNDAGLAVAALDVVQTGDGASMFRPDGVPLAFVFRRILEECTTVDEAEKLLHDVQATTCMNLAVCDRNQGAVFEITTRQVARMDDAHDGRDDDLVACTNHFRSDGLKVDGQCWRLPLLEAPIEGERPLDVTAVHKRLSAVNQGPATLQTMVFEPRALVVHLAMGDPPATGNDLTRIDLGPLFEP